MFTHLHVHTDYSMLDGLARLDPLVDKAASLGMKSLAITDHGGLYGAVDFYRKAKKSGVKPIIGCEMYVATGSRFDRNPSDKIHHLTVLAKDAVGYKNLVKLVTASHLEGYYKRPRVDREILEAHSSGLAVLSGCPSGEVPWLIAQGRYDEAKEVSGWYKEVFGTYFLELMQHGGVPELPEINKGLLRLNTEVQIPLVATNDSHYVDKQNAIDHEVLLCIQTNTNIQDDRRMRFEEDSYHLKTHDEMMLLFPDSPEAIANTEMVAEMCELELDFSQARLPEFPVPGGMTSNQYLAEICWKGYEEKVRHKTQEYIARLEYELKVIEQTSFPDYFLVVWDIARFVRQNEIFFTVRGSAAASLVLYCLGVTDVDPMPFKLVFERFLNIERKEMPDIDMDFQDDRRQEVINYCSARYGREHVAHIITFGTFGARQSIRDAGRALGMSLESVDKVAKMIPERLNIDLDSSILESQDLNNVYQTSSDVKKLMDTARQLEGVTRHKSLHAAGVVISKEPLNDVVPLEFTSRGDDEGAVMTQYSMEPVAALGLLKMDFLGLVNLTVLDESLKLIKLNHGIDLTLQEIPLDDKLTFDMLSRGETVGVFQLESSGMTRNIRELKPSTLGDVAAMIALFRPGPMDHIGTFIDGKRGRRKVTYIHPAMKEILEETYGVIVYQDQVLHIAREFAGYSLGEADIVRKAMGKKDPAIMAEEKTKFITGSLDKGHSESLAVKVFDLIEPFAGYAFNKAHSVSYGMVSYWTAYMKANYPAEYMASFMNSYMDKKDRLIAAVADCRRMGIEILAPDINRSYSKFTIEENPGSGKAIRFGLAAIKNIGSEALRSFLDSRDQNGPYETLEQLCHDGDIGSLNKKAIECLVMSGSFDSFGDRTGLLEVSDRISSLAQDEANIRNSNQSTMFEILGDSVNSALSSIDIPFASTSDHQKRLWEVELMGISVSGAGNLGKLLSGFGKDVSVMLTQLQGGSSSGPAVLAGQISTVVDRMTRDNRPFKVVNIEVLDGSLEAVVWEDILNKTAELWEPGRIIKIKGNLRERDGEVTISVTEANEINLDKAFNNMDTTGANSSENGSILPNSAPMKNMDGNGIYPNEPESLTNRKKLVLSIRESNNTTRDQMLLDDIKRLLLSASGNDEVGLEIETESSVVVMEWPPVKINATPELESKLSALVGSTGKVTIQSLMF